MPEPISRNEKIRSREHLSYIYDYYKMYVYIIRNLDYNVHFLVLITNYVSATSY